MDAVDALMCGAVAGVAVDAALLPIDAAKTRLQTGRSARAGVARSYAGAVPALAASAPAAAVFFAVYTATRSSLAPLSSTSQSSSLVVAAATDAAAAAVGEAAASVIRVPTDVLKQRLQAGVHASTRGAVRAYAAQVAAAPSLIQACGQAYRGYSATLLREIPFAAIQFPLFELLKTWRHNSRVSTNIKPNDTEPLSVEPPLSGLDSAFCGAIAGAIAAATTTPLDVVRTRTMVSTSEMAPSPLAVAKRIIAVNGIRGLFAGLIPRVLWISLGGFVFLGTFDTLHNILISRRSHPRNESHDSPSLT